MELHRGRKIYQSIYREVRNDSGSESRRGVDYQGAGGSRSVRGIEVEISSGYVSRDSREGKV